jgi:dinuclear metal center YbgI/SA1388 family protein
MTASLDDVVRFLDEILDASATPDFPPALNGLQCGNSGTIRGVACAVDYSTAAIQAARDAGANLLLVHHGMFWGGLQPIDGVRYDRLKLLLENDIAVYASHLPLDRHATLGNNVLLARALQLEPTREFGKYQAISIGVSGDAAVSTAELVERARDFAKQYGGGVRVSQTQEGRVTRQWGIITGSGASSETLREAARLGIDTIIVGEGPHHTAVEASELDIVVIYAGHYATETLGVQALGRLVSEKFGVPWTFLLLPTGL